MSIEQVKINNQRIYDAGKQTEYDTFWDTFQSNGTRVNYGNAFGGVGWTDTLFKPKYDICPTDGYMMFRGTGITNIADLSVSLDFANTTNFQYMFQWASVRHIGTIDTRKATNVSNPFYYATVLETIDKLILKDDGTQNLDSNIFGNTNALKNIIIEGKIGKSVNFQWSTKLSTASIVSVIESLLDNPTGNLTVTLSQTAINNMVFPFTSEKTGITYNSWSELENTKDKWTISLV